MSKSSRKQALSTQSEAASRRSAFSIDPSHLVQLVGSGWRVLDLGCGHGQLLQTLREKRGCSVMGIDTDPDAIEACIRLGLPVIDSDIDGGLGEFPDQSFDLVIMNHTLQALRQPLEGLQAMLRIGKKAIVTYPNFAYISNRLDLMLRARMPENRVLPYAWYDTPNIHFCTRLDFRTLVRNQGWKIETELCLDRQGRVVKVLQNLFSSQVCVVLSH